MLLLGILQNVLTLSKIPAFWIDAVYGAIILIALVVSRVTGGTAEKLRQRPALDLEVATTMIYVAVDQVGVMWLADRMVESNLRRAVLLDPDAGKALQGTPR